MWQPREACEQTAVNSDPILLEPTNADGAHQKDVRLHIDLRRCTREHRLGDALALVHYLSGRVGRLDITVASEAQAGFGEVVTVIGKSHGLAVSVQ